MTVYEIFGFEFCHFNCEFLKTQIGRCENKLCEFLKTQIGRCENKLCEFLKTQIGRRENKLCEFLKTQIGRCENKLCEFLKTQIGRCENKLCQFLKNSKVARLASKCKDGLKQKRHVSSKFRLISTIQNNHACCAATLSGTN